MSAVANNTKEEEAKQKRKKKGGKEEEDDKSQGGGGRDFTDTQTPRTDVSRERDVRLCTRRKETIERERKATLV